MPKFECPHCSQSIDAPDDLAGADAECPACNAAITVPISGSKRKLPALSDVEQHNIEQQQKLASEMAKEAGKLEAERRDIEHAKAELQRSIAEAEGQAESQHAPNHNQPPLIPAQTSGLAVTSLVCGITSLFLSVLTGIPAVIFGHKALGKIKKSQRPIGGSGLATAGLVLGYITTGIFLLVFFLALLSPVLFKQQDKADRARAINNAKQLSYVLYEYDAEADKYPDHLSDLVDEAYIDQSTYDDLIQPVDWIYFSGQSSADNSWNFLLASKEPIADFRVVLEISGAVKTMEEDDYQNKLLLQE